jgi:hypothetical protein
MMPRWLTISAALSSLLCVAVFVTSAAGDQRGRSIRRWGINWWFNRRMLDASKYDVDRKVAGTLLPTSRPSAITILPGVSLRFNRMDEPGYYMLHRYVQFDFRAVAAMSAALPTLWVTLKLRRWFRSKPGCCIHCGYDLRASKDRCPECGAAIGAIRG